MTACHTWLYGLFSSRVLPMLPFNGLDVDFFTSGEGELDFLRFLS